MAPAFLGGTGFRRGSPASTSPVVLSPLDLAEASGCAVGAIADTPAPDDSCARVATSLLPTGLLLDSTFAGRLPAPKKPTGIDPISIMGHGKEWAYPAHSGRALKEMSTRLAAGTRGGSHQSP